MAKNFGVEVLISTAKATKELQAAEGQVRALDRSLANLDKTLKASNGNLEAAAKSIASIVVSSREAARASEDLAKAKIATSKADAAAASAADRHAVAQARQNQSNSAAAASMALATSRTESASRAAQTFATNQRNAASATDAMGNSLANQRYLLYDVGATYRTLALAAQAIPAASLAVAASYEKNFAQVIRTSGATGAAVGELKNELKTLGTEIPMTFAELSEIAKIGGQMDIPAESLGKFTEVVAKFVATADGVTIDKATESFGRMANLFAQGMNADETSDFFERLGSAISYTADNSVTSEAKISSMLEKIAPIGKSAGLSAVEVTSFASALSSVGLAPEISSGFLTRFFGGMNKDIANNTDTMQVYNKILGTTTDEFAEMYRNDPSGVLTGIVTELSKLDKVSQTKLLGELGVTGVRDIRVIQGLAQNLHVLEKAQKDTAEAFASGTYLDESSAGIFNTFAANLQKMATAVMNLGETMGSSILPVLSPIVQGITEFATRTDELLTKVPALKGLLGVLLAFSSIAGIWLAIKSAQAFVTAGMIGFQHVAKSGTGATLTLNGQMRMLATTMLMARGATDAQAQAMLRGATATQALRIAQFGTIGTTNALSASITKANIVAGGFGGTMRGVGSTLLGLAGGPIGIAIAAVGLLGAGFLSASSDAKASAQQIVSSFEQSADAGSKALGDAFAREKAGLFDAGSFTLIGKSWGDVAKQAGVSMGDISKAMSGTAADLDAFIKKIDEVNNHKITAGTATAEETVALLSLIEKLQTYRNEMGTTEQAANNTAEAQKALGIATTDTGDAFGEASVETDDYVKSLNDAIAVTFGMVDAQGAAEAALEKLGAGLQKGVSFETDSEAGRGNLANLQATLSAQALLLQQNITGGKMSAEAASAEYAAYVDGLMATLVANGVDPAQIQGLAQNALTGVQNVFNGQVIEVPLTVEDQAFLDNVIFSYSTVADFLAENTLTAEMDANTDPAAQQAWDLVNYLSELTGMPFESVLTAFGDPASTEGQQVAKYLNEVMGLDYRAIINADTSNAVTNVQQFGAYATGVMATVGNYINDFGASIANTGIPGLSQLGKVVQDIGSFVGGVNFGAPGIIESTRAVKQAIPQFQSAGKAGRQAGEGIARGFNDAAKAAGGAGKAAKGAGKSAGGAGKAAKKAGDAGKKAGKDLGKAAKDAKKDWDEAEQAISGFASRVGNAFGYVFDKTQGVQVAKDEYYSVLNGIQDRLKAQKQTLRDLRAENKSLNAERGVQLNDAAKLEKMAKYADAMGNTERAGYYRDEAKALKASAAETKNKVDANNVEIRTIEKGIGNLKGYSKAAIENRAEVRRLEQASLDVATAYAKSGASAKTVANATADWTKKAKDHGIQLGYSRKDVEGVTSKTSAYIDKLKKVPKTISTKITETKTTTFKASNQTSSGVNAANRAIRSIPKSKTSTAKVRETGASRTKSVIDNAAKNRSTTVKVAWRFDKNPSQAPKDFKKLLNPWGGYNMGGAIPKGYASGGTIPGTPPNDPREDNLMAQVDGKGMIRVRSGEFIQRQEAVDYYGSDIMNKINNMDIPRYAFGGGIGRSSNSGNDNSGVIDLSSETIQEIARLIERDVILYADNEQLANSVNRGNQLIAQKGGHGVIQ